jgi:hypothetical protein
MFAYLQGIREYEIRNAMCTLKSGISNLDSVLVNSNMAVKLVGFFIAWEGILVL